MRILVTGGASGLGASIVKLLAHKQDNTVFFTYSSSADSAQAIETAYANTKAIHCNFHDDASVNDLLLLIPDLEPDALVNNAWGPIHKEHFYKTVPSVYLDSFRHNILPTLQITQIAMKVFRKRKSGKIVNIISSAVVNKPPVGWSEYVANKAYLLAMSKAWATEGIKFGITSNSISPSFMLANMTSDTDERVIEQIQESHPLKKILTADEVSSAVSFMLSAHQHINGTNLVINAGADLL